MTIKKQGDQGATKKQRDPDFVGAEIALRRAAERVRRRAAETGSSVVVFRDGKVVWEKADGHSVMSLKMPQLTEISRNDMETTYFTVIVDVDKS